MKTVFGFVSLLLLTCMPANAYDVEIGNALVCDTQQQAERLVQLFDKDLAVAINAVNGEGDDPRGCTMVDIAYVQGRPLAMARSKSHTFQIVPIIALGANSPSGYRPVEPTTAVMLVEIKEFAV